MLRNWPKATEYGIGMRINKLVSFACELWDRKARTQVRLGWFVCSRTEEGRKEKDRMRESGRLLRGAHPGEKAKGPREEILHSLTHLPWTIHWPKNRALCPEREESISYEIRILRTSSFLDMTYRRPEYSLCVNTSPPRKSRNRAEFWVTN